MGGATKIFMTPEEAVEILPMVYGGSYQNLYDTRRSCQNFTYGLWESYQNAYDIIELWVICFNNELYL